MKISLVTHSFLPDSVGGRESYVYNLAEGLGRRGHEVKVFTCANGLFQRTYLKSYDHFTAYYFPTFNLHLGIATYRISWAMCAGLVGDDADIIHAHDLHHFTTLIASVAASLRRKPLIVTEHGYPPLRGLVNWIMMTYEHAIIPLINRSCARIIAISKFIARELIGKYHVNPRKIVTVPNAIDPSQYVNSGRNFSEDYSLRTKRLILAVGRQTEVKGFQFLIEAFARISDEYPDTMLVLVGPRTPYSINLHNLASTLKLEGRVLFTGPLAFEEVVSAISSAEMVVIPSLYEPFGIIGLEALCCKTPVIASKVGGLSEIFEDHYNGFLVEPGNESELRDRMCMLLNDGHTCQKFRRNSQATLRKFDWNRFVESMEEIYRDQIASKVDATRELPQTSPTIRPLMDRDT